MITKEERVVWALRGYRIEESTDGNLQWYKDDKLHREDGPAIMNKNGTRAWAYRGEFHRTDGPAVIFSNGDIDWFVHGEKLDKAQIAEGLKTGALTNNP